MFHNMSYANRGCHGPTDVRVVYCDMNSASTVDAAHMDLFRLTALERRLGEILGRHVDLLPDPPEKLRLRANIDRDRRRAF